MAAPASNEELMREYQDLIRTGMNRMSIRGDFNTSAKELQDCLRNHHSTQIQLTIKENGEFTGFRLSMMDTKRKGYSWSNQVDRLEGALNDVRALYNVTFPDTRGMPRLLAKICYIMTKGVTFNMSPNVEPAFNVADFILPEVFKKFVAPGRMDWRFSDIDFLRQFNGQKKFFPVAVLEWFPNIDVPMHAILFREHADPQLYCHPKRYESNATAEDIFDAYCLHIKAFIPNPPLPGVQRVYTYVPRPTRGRLAPMLPAASAANLDWQAGGEASAAAAFQNVHH